MRSKWTTVAACALFSMLAGAQVCEYLDDQGDPLPYLVESRDCFTEGCTAKEVKVRGSIPLARSENTSD